MGDSIVLTEHKGHYSNGNTRYHFYRNEHGREEGFAFQYFESGNLMFKAKFCDGNCELFWYFENGDVERHDVWINDEFYAHYDDLSEIDKFELSLKYGDIWF